MLEDTKFSHQLPHKAPDLYLTQLFMLKQIVGIAVFFDKRTPEFKGK
jgi:hypothetical protein